MSIKRVLMIIFVVLIPFLLILFSYKVILGFTDYDSEQREVIDFLQGEELVMDMTSEETSHLEDVKEVMKKTEFVFYFLLLACTLIVGYFYNSKSGNYLKRAFFYGGLSAFGLAVLIFVPVLVGFDFLFNVFHQFFFPQGGWIFSADSLLIEMFPMAFFISMARRIVLLTLFLASFFILGVIYGDILARLEELKIWVIGVIILAVLILFLFVLLTFFVFLLPVIILLVIFGALFFLFKKKKKKSILDVKFKVKR
jgi:integral membrane protein (TIGR01906 family)